MADPGRGRRIRDAGERLTLPLRQGCPWQPPTERRRFGQDRAFDVYIAALVKRFSSKSLPDFIRELIPILALLALAVLIAEALPALTVKLRGYPWDGEVDWSMARALVAHENPYVAEGLKKYNLARWGGIGHPPTVAAWFVPIASVPLGNI